MNIAGHSIWVVGGMSLAQGPRRVKTLRLFPQQHGFGVPLAFGFPSRSESVCSNSSRWLEHSLSHSLRGYRRLYVLFCVGGRLKRLWMLVIDTILGDEVKD